MSTHAVRVERILSVENHPNADRLDLVTVQGWVCVTSRDAFKVGDRCLYIPIDSMLPMDIQETLFKDSKVKPSKGRIKTVKIRGAVSQGMCVPPKDLGIEGHVPFGTDVAARLGITKYEPPKKANVQAAGEARRKKRDENPHFKKFTDLENIKNYIGLFKDGERVSITEKIHGTNFRAGWVPWVPRTWWDKILKWAGRAPKWEFVYGSRNMQLQSRKGTKTFYDTNVYAKTVEQYDLIRKIPSGVVIFGEIYGSGIQPGYHYGCHNIHELVCFDVMENGAYLDATVGRALLESLELPVVPELYVGQFSMDTVRHLTGGPSVLNPSQTVREGVVIRPVIEGVGMSGRRILKSINPDYLLSKHADEEVAHDLAG